MYISNHCIHLLERSQNYVCVCNRKTLICVCVCDAVCVQSQNLFCALAQTWFVTQFLVVGAGGWLTAHQLTKSQALLPSLSTHPLVSSVQKKSLPGVGGLFLTRGKWEVKVLVQGEATAH
jgi:hypothetical protein